MIAVPSARAAVIAIVVVMLSAPAGADEPTAIDASQSQIEAARRAEAAFDFATAHEIYARLDASDAALPRVVRRRLAYLEQRREGDFVPLSRLAAFQSAPDARRRSEDVARFEATVRGFPAGRVRLDAHAALVQAYLATDDPTRALDVAGRWERLPEADERERDQAARARASALVRAGRTSEAADVVAETSVGGTAVESRLRSRARAVYGVRIAYAIIAAFAVSVIVSVARAGRGAVRAIRPSSLVALALASVGPMLIAERYDHDASTTFESLATATFTIGLAALLFGGALGERRASMRARRGAAVLSACSMLSAAYIVLAANEGIVSYTP